MASTYSNSLRLELIATGEAAATWGDKTNVNLTNIASAFGYATQDGFGANADSTTTVADGAADPARAMYFKVTSSATLTATRTLTIAPNTISRVMWIENATTGGQSIAISQGTGANVTIATGKTAVVYLDGAGSGAAVVDAMAGVSSGASDTLAEILAAGNTTGGTDIAVGTGDDITFADNSKAIFGAGSDLQIYHDPAAGSIIQEGGSGSLFIRASTNIQLEGVNGENMAIFNENGSVQLYYDNAEKLATTTSGIDVTGTVTADGLTVETSADPALITLRHTGNTSGLIIKNFSGGEAQLVNVDNGPMVFKTNDTERLRITSAGNVGIGVVPATTQTLTAQITNGLSLFGNNTTPYGFISNNHVWATGTGDKYLVSNYGASYYKQYSGVHTWATAPSGTAGNPITFTPVMTLDASGNVGIGVTPSAWGSLWKVSEIGLGAGFGGRTNGTQADVYENLYRDATNAYKYKTSAAASVYTQVVGNFIWSNAGVGTAGATATLTERMRINSDGSLVLNNAGGDAQMYFGGTSGTNRMYIARSGSDSLFWNVSNGVMRFGTNNAEAMRIDALGNLLVGKTASSFTTAGVELAQGGTAGKVQIMRSSGGLTVVNTTDDGAAISIYKGTAAVGSITSRGGATLGLILNPASGTGAGLSGTSNAIFPVDETTTPVNDQISLGTTNNRFKDLFIGNDIAHLDAAENARLLYDKSVNLLGNAGTNVEAYNVTVGNGIYLGGTAAVNLLDDYEEGTWDPSLEGSTTGGSHTYGYQNGKYTKVGNTVTASFGMYISTKDNTMNGNVLLSGLPVSASMGTNVFANLAIGWAANITYGDMLGGYINSGTSIALRLNNSAAAGGFLQSSAIGSGSVYLFGTITYQV